MNQASNRLTWIFGIALVVALVVIAFLLGRETKQSSLATQPEEALPTIEEGREEVVTYFERIDQIQAGPTGISPDAYAQQLAAEASQGNAKGFDQLEDNLVLMENKLRAVVPPAACKEYHQLTLATVDDAKALMTDLHRVFSGGGDASPAAALASRAQSADERVKKLQSMRRSIEKRYGLTK